MLDWQTLRGEMTAWRHELHAHPEFGFEVRRTAAFVAAKLREFGLDEVVEGVGGAGVVGTLKRGSGRRSIALRADMDALRLAEQGTPRHRSTHPGLMHACGHDGHTAMLLGGAKILAGEGGFEGTVRFIFQPAEEWGKGALAMLRDGLLERFPFDEIYGLHNMPGHPVGRISTRAGAIMSAEDNFEITLGGVGGHASRPHAGSETLVAGCALVLNLQTIVSRRLDPADTAVVSVTEFLTDGTRNVLPGETVLRGDVRSFGAEVSAEVERQMRVIAEGIATAYRVAVEVGYTREFVPLINDAACADEVLAVAREVCGGEGTAVAEKPITASEDFAHFLSHVPGCFAFIGNGVGAPPLHNPSYDFDDANLLAGARFHAAIARRRLG
ncbi:MAG TPA: amidohydrolase [Anaeromyxobacteraceae bacterium]|nr:amidohydrolase [Anaeromyxobacteraceae bacterium]